jgi:hypothetical protein
LRISQKRNSDAVQLLQRSLALWQSKAEEEWPSYEFRMSSAKLLLELQQPALAVTILERLTEEVGKADDDDAGETFG